MPVVLNLDLLLVLILITAMILTYMLRYFVDADAVKKEDLPRLIGGIWIPSRLLTPRGRKIRYVRDAAAVVAIVLVVVLQNTPYKKEPNQATETTRGK